MIELIASLFYKDEEKIKFMSNYSALYQALPLIQTDDRSTQIKRENHKNRQSNRGPEYTHPHTPAPSEFVRFVLSYFESIEVRIRYLEDSV